MVLTPRLRLTLSTFAESVREAESRPVVSRRELTASRIVVAIATIAFALAASWELFGPILAGHYASSASMGIIADNMRRWGIAGPVWSYSATRPGPDQYYCHHPWGIFWTTRVFFDLFGRHDYVCRLPAVVLSVATPPLLGAIARRVYRPAAGAAAAVAFVVLPISLSFAAFNALEVPVIAHSSLFLWGWVRLVEDGKRRHLLASVVGAFLALNADWPAFVLVGTLLAIELVRLVGFGGTSPRVVERRRAQWWALVASTAVLTFVTYLVAFRSAGKLDDLLGSYQMRSAGNEATLAQVLASRRYWIELMFTPVAIVLGKAFVPVGLARFAARRRAVELVPFAVLVMALVQYVVFKQGADIHIFWPHYFAQFFALAAGALVASSASLLSGIFAASRPTLVGRAWVLSLGAITVPLALVLRDGIPALVLAHATGGRFNEKGLRIQSDADKIALLRWLAPRRKVIGLHESAAATWADVWALGGRPVDVAAAPPPAGSRATTVVDVRFLPDATKVALFDGFGVVAAGPYWALTAEPGKLDVMTFHEAEPSIVERYLTLGTEPRRSLGPDPFAAWELATHYGRDVAAPAAEARSFDEHRVLHNVAIARGDEGAARVERAALLAECRPLDVELAAGTKIVCARFVDGAAPTLTLLLDAAGPLPDGAELSVTSRVVARAPLSTTMADPTVRETSFPFVLAPSRFRRGFLYGHTVVVRKRPGTEVFEASLHGHDVPRAGRPVEVLRL
jgi:4-amino-4-deoxy-L-arabinose transferase-like glycosyltransferase